MAIAEGRTIPFVGPEAIDVAVLETFEYAGPEQEIVTETREFSAVCPYSGLPDFATLRIHYVPSDRCVELKSLKYYVTSYRTVGIFQEHATARIAEDLFRLLAPKRLTVTTVYNVRGRGAGGSSIVAVVCLHNRFGFSRSGSRPHRRGARARSPGRPAAVPA
jgi:7-cyano-7-deazaguanine reductase